MAWEFKKGVPIYLQIMEIIESDLLNGKYQAGEKLPSVRELAMEAGVNPNTMQKAYLEMDRMGLIYTERTSGRFVTTDEDKIHALKNALSIKHVDAFFDHLHALGFTDHEILDTVKEKCKGES